MPLPGPQVVFDWRLEPSLLSVAELDTIAATTLGHYEANADAFWAGTRDHDVQQNRDALLRHIGGPAPHTILDLGCGPGRDLIAFGGLGHRAIGLDGSARFCELARLHSGCQVLHQNLLALELPAATFDGIFANAVLFHVPLQELPQVLSALWVALVPDGVFFCSNPRGDNQEGWQADRYGCYHDHARWQKIVSACGFDELEHYYRPPGLVCARQPWLATVYRKRAAVDGDQGVDASSTSNPKPGGSA